MKQKHYDPTSSYIEYVTSKQLEDALMKAKEELAQKEARIRELEDALQQVVDNWEYQKKTGWKHFTSAPTEFKEKLESKKKTIEMVTKALSEKSDKEDDDGQS